MSNKFTQEEYRKIVELHDKRDFPVDGTLDVIKYFVHNISRTGNADIDTALAIANPLTREWAYDQFVEKEKEYRWIGKKLNINGKHMLLYKSTDGDVRSILVHENGSQDTDEALTESEIKAWGYNPEMFDREEVK